MTTTPDLLDEGFYADLDGMHEAFTHLRAADPVYRDPATGIVAVTRHADVIEVERRARVFVSSRGYRSVWAPDEDNMIALDDPGHAAQRALVARRLTPRGVARDEQPLRAMVGEMLDAVADDGQMEVVDALAAQLPSRLTADLLGFPQERWRDLKAWSERVMRIDSISRDPSGQVLQGVMSAVGEFEAYLAEAVPRFRSEPDDSFISIWANATIDGCPMRDATISNETGLFIAGGGETTRTAIARGLRAFCDHPEQWDRLADDPSLVRARWRRCCGGCPRSTRCSGPPWPTTGSAASPCRRVTGSRCCTRPPTGTSGCSPIRSASTSPGPQPAHRVRVRTARVHRAGARPARAAGRVRGDAAPLQEPQVLSEPVIERNIFAGSGRALRARLRPTLSRPTGPHRAAPPARPSSRPGSGSSAAAGRHPRLRCSPPGRLSGGSVGGVGRDRAPPGSRSRGRRGGS
jgi:cytochrome P450